MRQRKAGLGFILVTLILDILGIGLVVPILPRLVETFTGNDAGVASSYVGWLTATYAAMQFIFSPILGSVSDRFGRRPVLLLSMVGFCFNYLLLAWAPTLAWFFLARAIAGICGATIGTASAYIADVSPPEKRAQNFGLLGMAFGIGFVAGPLTGGVLGSIDLRLPFLVSAGLTMLNAIFGLIVLPESLTPEHRRPFSWSRANPFGLLGALGRYPVVLGLAVSVFFLSLAQRGLESIWVLYTEHRFHWDIRMAGYSLGAVGVMAAIVQGGLVRRIVPALGERRAIVVGVSVATLTYVLFGLAPAGWMAFAIIAVAALGNIAAPAAQGILSKAVPPNEQGMLMGGLSSLNSLTMVVGPLVSTSLFRFFISPKAPLYLPGASFFGSALMAITGLVLALRTFARVPQTAAPSTSS